MKVACVNCGAEIGEEWQIKLIVYALGCVNVREFCSPKCCLEYLEAKLGKQKNEN